MTNRLRSARVIASTEDQSPVHPGRHVRDSILFAKKLKVKEAAQLLGVGAPALSNFLNGKAATTPEMAFRIERSFGMPAAKLLEMQAAYDTAEAKAGGGAPANAIPYVVPFLGIKAAEIESWVERNIPARSRLSVLLRVLVNSTGRELSEVDFPGNDDAERPGRDGFVDAGQGTPWIPAGASHWEIGTTKDVKRKADSEFAKSMKETSKEERSRITFIFVTPRHWPGKTAWADEMRSKALWRGVRAYDSSDLEQWLEQSIPAQVWFSDETMRAVEGVRSLDHVWAAWANVADPPLAGSFFAVAVSAAKETLTSRLKDEAPKSPIIIAADSTGEGLAFLAQAFGALGDDLKKYRDQVLVFEKPGVLPRLALGAKNFIAVTANREVERELGPLAQSIRSIVVYPRNATTADPNIVLEPLNYETFRTGLEEMGYDRDAVERYASESGRSLTVLRRRLSKVPVVRAPEWAANPEIAAQLIPFLFVGAWSSINAADQVALSLLANRDYDSLESDCQRLAALDDAPIWSVGPYRGAVSKIDLLYAIAGSVTAPHLKRYFELAALVLGEDDPKLDLPEADRWAAAMHGKRREFSGALREGVSETLVLLAVHGDRLFHDRPGFDCEMAVNKLVRSLLSPLKTRLLEANDRDLPAYAEAAPNEFLSILEEDLRTADPAAYDLMRPADIVPFGGCPRSGLLWALEGLAWNPATLPRVAQILAQLAEIEINDNWTNKPINSLKSIFDARMPQTAADHQARVRIITQFAKKYSRVAWNICIAQLSSGHWTGHYSHKPRWRNDGYGYGGPHKTRGLEFRREMTNLALGWEGGHSKEMLGDLVERLPGLDDADQAKVWKLIESWAANASDADKPFVREKIRVTVLSQRARRSAAKTGPGKLSDAAKAAYAALEPSDLLARHEWLFRQHWVEESADELSADEFDFDDRERRVRALRVAALREVFEDRGTAGVLELAEMGEAAAAIGFFMASDVLAEVDVASFLLAALPPAANSESGKRTLLLRGTLEGIRDEKKRIAILKAVKRELAAPDFVRLLTLAPFRRSTWRLVHKLTEGESETYWREVEPDWIRESHEEANEAVERLLTAHRPRAAFASAHLKLESIEAGRLFRMMAEIAKGGDDPPEHHKLEPYYIEKAMQILDESPIFTLDQKAGLEFAYLDALSRPGREEERYGIPNLEKYVEQHPEFFARAVVWTYKRRSDGEDPPEWKVPSDQVQQFAERGYKLLNALRRTPGRDDPEEHRAERLAAWVKNVREACARLGRGEMGDHRIGQLLAHAPPGDDGVWPCEPVRAIMEEMRSDALMEGAFVEVLNSRGVVWRGQGGAQERELANKYRAWENELRFSCPFVASDLLGKIAAFYEREARQEDTEAGIRRRLP